jgi:hypothetical protein
MAVMSVRIPDNEYRYATQFASFNGISLGEYIRNLIEEKIEDFEDEKAIKELEKDMLENPEDYKKTYTLEEVAEELEF